MRRYLKISLWRSSFGRKFDEESKFPGPEVWPKGLWIVTLVNFRLQNFFWSSTLVARGAIEAITGLYDRPLGKNCARPSARIVKQCNIWGLSFCCLCIKFYQIKNRDNLQRHIGNISMVLSTYHWQCGIDFVQLLRSVMLYSSVISLPMR